MAWLGNGFLPTIIVTVALLLASVQVGSTDVPREDPGAGHRAGHPSLGTTPLSRLDALPECSSCVIANITVGVGPVSIAFDNATGDVVVASNCGGSASFIATSNNTLVHTTSLPGGTCQIEGVGYDGGNGKAYFGTNHGGGFDVVYAANGTFEHMVATGDGAATPLYDASLGEVFGSNYYVDSVSVIQSSSDSVVATIPLTGDGPESLALDTSNGDLFVGEIGHSTSSWDRVSVISTGTDSVRANITVGLGPAQLAYDPVNRCIYIADGSSDNVTVVNGTTWRSVASVTVGSGPSGISVDPISGDVFVANSGSDNISEISPSTNTVLRSFTLGAQSPAGLFYDPGNGDLYVTDYDGDTGTTVSVISIKSVSAPAISSFTATPVPLVASTAPSGSPFQPSGYLTGLCGATATQSLAGCAKISWSTQNAVTCTLSTDDPLFTSGQTVACGSSSTQILIPMDSGAAPVSYQFTLAASASGGVSVSSQPLVVYALPASTQSSSTGGSSLALGSVPFDHLSSCSNLVNILGCWGEVGVCSDPSSSTTCVPSLTDSDGIPIAATVGYGFSEGAESDYATAAYPGSVLSSLPAGYDVEYYSMANAWTAHIEACGTAEGGAGSGYFVSAFDSTGASYQNDLDSVTCVELQTGNEIGNEVNDAYHTLSGTDDISLPDASDIESSAASLATGMVNTEIQQCASGSSLCQEFNDLANSAGPAENYFGEAWSANPGKDCSYSLSVGPNAIEVSMGFLVGSGELAASIVETSVSGIATPSSSPPTACTTVLNSPARITLTLPDVNAGSESLIQGTVQDSWGNPITGTSVGLTVTGGSFLTTGSTSATVTTGQDGVFTATYQAPSTGAVSVGLTTVDGSVTQQGGFSVYPSTYPLVLSDGIVVFTINPGSIVITVSGATPGARLGASGEVLSALPGGLPNPTLSSVKYFDVAVDGSTSGNATVCLPYEGTSSSVKVQYLSGLSWTDARSTVTNDTSTCGSFRLSSLMGTLIVVGVKSTPSTFLGLPGYEGYALVGVAVAVAATMVILLLLHKRKKEEKPRSSLAPPPEGPPSLALPPPA